MQGLAKYALGIAPQRKLPALARQSFERWFRGRRSGAPPSSAANNSVVLWPDTFNNYFHPETAIAAVEGVEAAGCEVRPPPRKRCCWRPPFHFQFLDRAKAPRVRTMPRA